MRILPVLQNEDFQSVEALAFPIWREHYTPIIGAAQVEYMLQKFQTVKGMREQVAQGVLYFLLQVPEGGSMGFLAVTPKSGELYLNKLYLLKEHRGKGYARQALRFLMGMAREKGFSRITLAVNKWNPAVKAYEALGFRNAGPVVTDIGGGFLMDDYRMVLELPKKH